MTFIPKRSLYLARTIAVAALLFAVAVLPALSYSAQEGRTVVAEVLGKKVYEDELVPAKAAGEQKAKLSPADYAAWHERTLQERFRGIVWSAVFSDFAGKRHIEPTDAEVESQIRSTRKFMEEDKVKREKDRQALIKELKSPTITEKRRKEAQEYLDVLERSREMDEKIRKMRSGPGSEEVKRKAELNVARMWVKQWKVNQALYREFGGRIVFQQAGWEPIDAYRAVLEQYEKQKAFVVHDPSLRDAVYSYFTLKFVYAGEKQGKFYFERPWWERTKEEMKAAGF
jgi:hypothetical protein